MAASDDARARLDTLGTQLGEVDQKILELVASRQALAQKIGQVKREAGIPTRDYRQERDVVERARAAAVKHGLSPTMGEELILALIRGSLTIQEKDTVTTKGEGNGRRVLVLDDATAGYELIVVVAQMPATAEILEQMAANPPKGVVFDVGSLKSPLRKSLHALRAAGGNVTSIHPMFGPDTELLSGRHVIFVDVGAPDATAAARALFEPTMATLVEMDLE